MKFSTLIVRSLRFHARAHLGTLLGAAVGSAVLIGALVVGDSVRESLRTMALARLGRTEFALASNDRFFREKLADDLKPGLKMYGAPALQTVGIAASSDGSTRANRVQILGVDGRFWVHANPDPNFLKNAGNDLILNQPLATHLKVHVGDMVLLRLQKPSSLSRDVPLASNKDSSIALRLKVGAIVSDEEFGRFSLQASQTAPFNAFIPLKLLQEKLEQSERANLLLLPVQVDTFAAFSRTMNQAHYWKWIPFLSLRNELTRHWAEAEFARARAEAVAKDKAEDFNRLLRDKWRLSDAEIDPQTLPDGRVEIRSRRVFRLRSRFRRRFRPASQLGTKRSIRHPCRRIRRLYSQQRRRGRIDQP